MVEIPVWVLPLVASLGALAGAIIPYFIFRKSDQADRRNQAIPALAETRDVIDRLAPDPWAINANSSSLEKLEEVKAQWKTVRSRVLAIRGLYGKHAQRAEAICVTVDGLLVEVGWLVVSTLEHRDIAEWRDRANDSQSRSRADTNELMRIIGS